MVKRALLRLHGGPIQITKDLNLDAYLEQTEECEYIDDADELIGITEIVCDYIKALYHADPKTSTQNHWLVSKIKQHADQTFCYGPTLKELSVLYHKNEKYMGRTFKKEMGMTFHHYCLMLRLKKAELLLSETSDKIIDIALECGFNNVSYFNRAFKAQYGMSPSEFVHQKNTILYNRNMPNKKSH